MNYRVLRQITDQAETFGRRVITRGHVIADPEWNIRTLVDAGFLTPVDAPVTLHPKGETAVLVTELEEVPAEILADIEPDSDLNQSPVVAEDHGGDAEAIAVPATDFHCRHDGCDKGPWDSKRARTCHEVAVHGSPGG